MKKFGFLALVISLASFGTSIRPVALESVDMPLGIFTHTDSTAKIIRVSRDGEVFGGTCEVRPTPSPAGEIDFGNCEWKTVKFFSVREMNRIVRLTNSARHGLIQYPNPSGIHCLAMPSHSLRMVADNGSILLKQGAHPCGFQTFNTSAAAKQLVEELNKLRAEYNHLVD